MDESKNLQRSFSMPDILETYPSSSSPGSDAATLFSKSHAPGGLGIGNKVVDIINNVRSSNVNSNRGFQHSTTTKNSRQHQSSDFDLLLIKKSLIMSVSQEDNSESNSSREANGKDDEIGGHNIGAWSIATDIRNVSVLKNALTQAQSAIIMQTDTITQQARRIEYLENLLTKLQEDNIGNISCQTIKLSPDHSIALDSVKEVEDMSNSSPGDGVVNSYFSALGVVNHRDLTRFAVRRRLISPSIESDPVANSDNPRIIRGNSTNIKNVRVNTDDTGHATEIFYSPTNFITPTNSDYLNSKHSDNNTFVSIPFSGSDPLGDHNISPIECTYSPDESSDSHETTNSSGHRNRNVDFDDKYLEDSVQRQVPPKGLAARLAMSANERRKVATSGRFKKLSITSVPSSLILNQHNNNNSLINAKKSPSGNIADDNNYYGTIKNAFNGESTTKNYSTPSSQSSDYYSDDHSNISSSILLFQPSKLPLSPRPFVENLLHSDSTSGSQSRFANNQLSYSTSKLPISSFTNYSDEQDSGLPKTVPPPRPVSSFQYGRRMTPDKNYREMSRNIEINIGTITDSSNMHLKSTRISNNAQSRNRAISHDAIMNNDVENSSLNGTKMSSKNQISSRPVHSSIFNWRGVSYSYGEKNSLRSDVYIFIAHDNPRLINDYNSTNIIGSSGTPIVGSSMAGMEVMIETKNDLGLTCFVLATIVCNGSFDSVQDVNFSDQRGCAWIVCNKLKAFRAKLEEFPSRIRGEIREIDLEGPVENSRVDLSHLSSTENFFSECSSKVDVILDPYRTGYWFPYFEGHRKMAPQFRSKGIGYLRLGDDMSQFGTAFISLNAGQSYLDFGKLASTKLIDDEKKAKIIAEKRAKIAKNRGAKKL